MDSLTVLYPIIPQLVVSTQNSYPLSEDEGSSPPSIREMCVKRAQNNNGLRKIVSLSSKQNLERKSRAGLAALFFEVQTLDSYLAVLPARPLSNGPRWHGLISGSRAQEWTDVGKGRTCAFS